MRRTRSVIVECCLELREWHEPYAIWGCMSGGVCAIYSAFSFSFSFHSPPSHRAEYSCERKILFMCENCES